MNTFSAKNGRSHPDPVDQSSPSKSNRATLLTGATGLLGQYLMRDLLDKGQQVAVLVRASKKLSARERVEQIFGRMELAEGRSIARPVVLEGDLENDSLSLSHKEIDWVQEHCDRVIHNAAVLTFTGADRSCDPWKTNVGGTGNALSFCREQGLKHLHYVSTAYVSGKCESMFSESDLDIGQEFRNDYEESKFESEQLVRQSDGFDSKTIFRPAVIVGDSVTGFTSTYHGLYLYLRLMATLIPMQPVDADGNRQTPISLPMTGDEPRNLVPVDWVSKVMADIVCNPDAHDQTYHLVPSEGLTARQLIDYCYEYFNSSGVDFCEPNTHSENENDFAQNYLENIQVYSAYDTSDPSFDDQNRQIACGHLPCPVIDKEMIFRFLDFGIADRWGKRKTSNVDRKAAKLAEVPAV